MREPGGGLCVIHLKGGIVQGAPDTMFHYVVGMLLLTEKLREMHGSITSPFYADNLNLAGRVQQVARAFVVARRYGPSTRYFAGVPKSWCVHTAADGAEVKAIMLQHDIVIQYTRGTIYVGGYIGSEQMEDE